MRPQAALREGASIETGAPVESVIVGMDGAARGVRLAGGEEARRPSPCCISVLPFGVSVVRFQDVEARSRMRMRPRMLDTAFQAACVKASLG